MIFNFPKKPLVALYSLKDLEKPHRDIEIDRNWRSEELLKLGRNAEIMGRSKTFHYQMGREEGACFMQGRSEKFHGERGVNFLWRGAYLSAYYKFITVLFLCLSVLFTNKKGNCYLEEYK